jgi:hypothetical protein
VPWLARPLPLYHAPPFKLVRSSEKAPPCRASQLRVKQGRGGGALGTWYQRIVFTNIGSTTCLVRAGTTLSYVVTLRNPTRRQVALAPCPGFTEGLYADGLVVQHSFELNCGAARSISAGGHAGFEMRLEVPARAQPGLAKLAWSLDTPTGPSTGTEVTLRALRVASAAPSRRVSSVRTWPARTRTPSFACSASCGRTARR